jgi:hypothetical protein
MRTRFRNTCLFAALAAVSYCTGAARAEDCPRNVPPEGFRALFNGKDLTGWTEGGKTPEHWKVEQGVLVFDGKGTNLLTTEKFDNFVLLVDWMVKNDGNSGVYLRGTKTQVEINDHDRAPGKIWAGTSGGLYPQLPPTQRAAKPAGEWNHYEITVDEGVITVKLNGETTVDGYEMHWGGTESGPVGFQNHGTPLWFKNIFIKPLP